MISRIHSALRLIALALGVALIAHATAPVGRAADVTLQFNDATAKDVFVYEFLSGANLDNFVFGKVNFGTLLATSNTGSESPHNINALLQFDLSGLGLFHPGQVESAALKLRVIDAKAVGFPVVNPTVAFPVDVSVKGLGSSWNEQTVTWLDQPGTVGGALATTKISAINQTVSFDLTAAAKSWVTSPSSNFGIRLSQDAEVRNGDGKAVGAVFASSAFGSNLPSLEIDLAAESPGDANFDGLVDGADYTIWADNFGASPRVFAQGDFNHSGTVEGGDYTIWADNFNPGGPALASAVPEPATLTLVAAALPAILVAAVGRWRRRVT